MRKIHPMNMALAIFGLQISRATGAAVLRGKADKGFRKKYNLGFEQVKNNRRGFEVYKEYRCQVGEHPRTNQELEFEFVAQHLYREKPLKILDVGSYRHFILGLLAHYDVTTVDFRGRKTTLDNETVVTCDAKALNLSDNCFDAVVTLDTLPHIGLGRYGDEIDLDGDLKAFNEMVRVLKPDGVLIFSAAITGAKPSIAWNARRNYNYDMIREFCKGLALVEEKFIDRGKTCFCALEDLTSDPPLFDYYIGCWRKKCV